MQSLLEKSFNRDLKISQPDVVVTPSKVQIGNVSLLRQTTGGILCNALLLLLLNRANDCFPVQYSFIF